MPISSLIAHRTTNRMEQVPATGVAAPLIAAATGAGRVQGKECRVEGGTGR